MSLGGYKYKGYSVQKSDISSATDKKWALAIHKCRVKAFLESVSESGASWVVARTQGDIDLVTANDDGYIYIIEVSSGSSNDDNQGYATYFKYMENNQAIAYYLILTVPNSITNMSSGDSASDGYVDFYIGNTLEYLDSTNYKALYMGATCFYAISLEDFGNHPREIDYLPVKSTRLIPCGAITTYTGNSMYPLATKYLSYGFIQHDTSVSFGVCTKSGTPDIIDFCKSNNTSSTNWNVNIISPRAISQNVYDTDTYKLASVKINSNVSSSNTSGETATPAFGGYSILLYYLNQDGALPWGYYSEQTIDTNKYRLCYNGLARGSATNTRKYGPFGIVSTDEEPKGFLNSELIAFSWQSANQGEAVSEGKYLCVTSRDSTYDSTLYSSLSSSTGTLYVYVGWDEDNPEINSPDANPNYIPDINFPAE